MINELPRLAVGSHEAGSGKACVMNAISMINYALTWNLTRDWQRLDIGECGYCGATVQRYAWDQHKEWHERQAELIKGLKR